jgi:excinuclease ABC subunit C
MINISKIPEKSGCYLFKDKFKKIIYIGKAKNLKKRVLSYFQKKERDEKTIAMISHINFVDFIITRNEVEALILENNLIKKESPKYNIDLKDSKRYAYIEVTQEKFPRLLISRKISGNSLFFGPFVSAQSRDYILSALKRVFKIRTCKKLPKKSCLRFQLGLCDAPCIKNISNKDYGDRVNSIKEILKGKTLKIVSKLEKKMAFESRRQNFEKAIFYREQIESIERLKEKQMMERQKKYNEDIINFVVRDNKVYLMLFNVYKGILENKQEFVFDYHIGFFEDFLSQYYFSNPVPKEIIVPKKVSPIIERYLSKIRGKKTSVIVPKKGEKKELLLLVKNNVEIVFFGDEKKLFLLGKKLNLRDIPRIIECFDISHISGSSMTGSVVLFRNAKPDKSSYRKFKIKGVKGIDDFAAIKEVVKRRYKRLLREGGQFPDLVVVDGGIGQLNSALEGLKEIGVKIPVISIAKKFEEIYVFGRKTPFKWGRKSQELRLIQEIRDEAHRFAVSYSKLLWKKSVFKN